MSSKTIDQTMRLPNGVYFQSWEKPECYSRILHVNQQAQNASDTNNGSDDSPFLTINAAAAVATPGTKVLIHQGVYRECVRPQQGGDSPDKMISYEAVQGEKVVIKASVPVTEFEISEGWDIYEPDIHVWKVKLNPDEFKGYNPFCAVNILHDRLFIEYDKTDMTTYLNRRGMVFCDGKPLQQVSLYQHMADIPGSYWVEANGQTVHFRLPRDENPEQHEIELSCREQCFAPDIPFLSFIRIKGIICAHAATGAPVPQRGAISCYRGHHWIIEKCVVDWSNGVGIDIGDECWHHKYEKSRITGEVIVRGCEIYNVGVCGIAGLFAKNILIEDNLFQGTGWQKMELSWEAGCIKVHGCSNSVLKRNVFRETIRADHLWMDMFNENNRITQNLFLDGIEQREAIFIECSRNDVNLIDNNIFWNIEGRYDPKDIPQEPGSSGWYKLRENSAVNGYAVYGEGTDRLYIAHNFIGKCRSAGYFAKPVSFRIAGRGGTSRAAKIYNNIFYNNGEAAIKLPTKDNEVEGNLYLNMPGGYLRILYPEPEVCLDLPAWQEFCRFDLNGQEGDFDIDIDTQALTIKIKSRENLNQQSPYHKQNFDAAVTINQIKKVDVREEISTDFSGTFVTERSRIPGPFLHWQEGLELSIDPRK